jgi:membrane-bound metal-dependent hydrolase YbcI (DUF457 family)
MPQAVTHVLLTIIVLDLFRDYIIKAKKKIPLHYIFIGGVFSILPDIDIPLSWLVNNILGFSIPIVHRTFTHTIFLPLTLLAITLLYHKLNNKKAATIFGIITFATFFHLLLDITFTGTIMPLYPFNYYPIGLNLLTKIGLPSFMEAMEAIILLLWLWHEEKKHKISDFI